VDKSLLLDLQETTKALKAAIIRSQNGITGLVNISKLGATVTAASAPNILNELRQLESEAQRLLKAYRDQLNKASLSMPPSAAKEAEQ
jgi:hypothetical protein